jgi:phosphoribosylanthranilate isomerase
VDPYQVFEARAAGADAVLLIVAALTEAELEGLASCTAELGLDALFEVHDEVELMRALRAGASLVGVNNRDLRTLEVSLDTGIRLAALVPDDVVAVAESGIRTPEDLNRLRDAGYDAFLIGERLLLEPDPGHALHALLQRARVRDRPVAVKVCGITSVEDALMVAGFGADAIGLVFWPGSPRAVDLATARQISAALPPFVLRVGVFVDPSDAQLVQAVDAAGLDIIQLHGSEPPERFASLPRRGLKAIGVGPGFRPEDALRYERHASGIVLDARVEGGPPGGTGHSFDWTLARAVRARASFLMLAGGLTPENVAQALLAVRPDAVDVSSGVELSPGRKDPQKVRAFLQAVRAAEPIG